MQPTVLLAFSPSDFFPDREKRTSLAGLSTLDKACALNAETRVLNTAICTVTVPRVHRRDYVEPRDSYIYANQKSDNTVYSHHVVDVGNAGHRILKFMRPYTSLRITYNPRTMRFPRTMRCSAGATRCIQIAV